MAMALGHPRCDYTSALYEWKPVRMVTANAPRTTTTHLTRTHARALAHSLLDSVTPQELAPAMSQQQPQASTTARVMALLQLVLRLVIRKAGRARWLWRCGVLGVAKTTRRRWQTQWVAGAK